MTLGLQTAIVLHDLDEPALMLGFAGVAADEHRATFSLSEQVGDFGLTPDCIISSSEEFPIGSRTIILHHATGLSGGRASGDLASRYDPDDTSDTGWDRLTALAHKTYVPASDQSRLHGAGAGLTDND